MSLIDTLKRTFGGMPPPPMPIPTTPSEPEPEEVKIVEVAAADLVVELHGGQQPLLLDCREDHEWRRVRIPGSLHIPMRQIPGRLAEIDRAANIVVVCAHGNRSYSVAGYLIENDFAARSLRGGIAEWQAVGGEVESDTMRAMRS